MTKCLMVCLLVAFLLPTAVTAEDPPVEVWVRTFDLGNDDWGEDIAVDHDGFVYVTGNTHNGTDFDWLTIKCDANGDTVWTRVFDTGNGDDIATALGIDNTGNIYVVGWTPDSVLTDWRMVKYGADGTELWSKVRDWAPDVYQGCHDIVVDTVNGSLFMVGDYIGSGGTWDYLTVRCDLDGNYQAEIGWFSAAGINDNGWAIAMDDSFNVYVTGVVWNATRDWGTIKYTPAPGLDWDLIYNSGSEDNSAASTIAVDNTGCVYVVGWAENVTDDWQITKLSSNGTVLWSKTIDTLGLNEGAWGIEVDAANNIYVNGDFDNGTNWDCRTIKCDSDGNGLWDVTYDGGSDLDDAGRGLAIDDSGYVYAVGHSNNGNDVDYLVIKYARQTGITEQYTAVRPASLGLEIINNPSAEPVLRYSLPKGARAALTLYSAGGSKIEEFSLGSDRSTFIWNTRDLPAGVYFGRLVFGDQSVSAKICLTK